MAARPKVPTPDLIQMLIAWKGNVAQAAAQLGIHPKNLRERCARLGLDLDEFRRGTYAGPYPSARHGAIRSGTVPAVAPGPVFRRGPVESGPSVSTLRPVQANQAVQPDETEIPIRVVPARRKAARLVPSNEDALAEFQRQVEARYRVDTDPTALLNQFFEEAFPAWSREKLAPAEAPAAPARRPRRGPS